MSFQIEKVKTKDLTFDLKNPRIAEFNLGTEISEKELIKILWDSMGVEEIVLSIKASGFFEHEFNWN